MGSAFTCCGQREQLLDLGGLASLDPALLASVEQLRKQHQAEIEQSYEVRQGGGIYRGGLDQNSRRTGYGELYRLGLVYLGEFSLDRPSGYGILIRQQDQYYRGDFQEGKYHGKGREFSQQHEFEGEYEYGQRRRGTLRTDDFEYQGEFRDNVFEGHGHLQFTDGSSYDGMFEGGTYHGRGFLAFQNSNKYEGAFEAGQYHGEGKFTWSDGISALCHFERGVRTARQMHSNNQPLARPVASHIAKPEDGQGKEVKWFQFREVRKVARGDGMLQL